MEKYNIGNYLKANGGNFISPGMVDNHYLSDHGICQMTEKGLVALNEKRIDVSPIEINHTWLIGLGFDQITAFHYRKNNFTVYYRFYTVSDIYFNGEFVKQFNYVHELQHEFFIATSVELNFHGSF